MNKIKVFAMLFAFFLFLPFATAKLCDGTMEIYESSCTMMQEINASCSAYNYTIYDAGGANQGSGLLMNWYSNNYIFDFNLSRGDYVVSYCDNSTRQISVVESGTDKGLMAVIILLPILLSIILIAGTFLIGNDHQVFKIAIALLSIVPFFSSMNLALITVAKYFNFPEMQDLLGTTTYWTGVFFGIIITYFIIYAFIWGVTISAQKKQKKREVGNYGN
jgi:hypothetical protein